MEPHLNTIEYIRSMGKVKLTEEFQSDSQFHQMVCKLLKTYADDKIENTVTSILQDAISILQRNLSRPISNLLIAAILDACGYRKESSQLMTMLIVSAIIGGLGILAIDLINESTKSKKRRRIKK